MLSHALRPLRGSLLLSAFGAIAILLACPRSSDAQIFADFETTQGNFTIEFFHETQPQATANFIGLADGSLSWLDLETLKVMQGVPYYDGTKFHRVIQNFMCQGGSRNGMGTDGPGYRFRDKFARTKPGDLLHPHDKQGLISMANSGINTNGSQFFITDVPTPWLDGKHIVFGEIAAGPFGSLEDGIAVITAMNEVPTTGSSPDTDLVINAVRVRRVGTDAESFDVTAQGLPILCEAQAELEIDHSGDSTALLHCTKSAYSQIDVYNGDNLQNWTLFDSTYYVEDNLLGIDISGLLGTNNRQFFRLNKVDYAPQDYGPGPGSLANTSIALTFNDSPVDDMTISIDESGADGTWRLEDGTEGTLASVVYVGNSIPLKEQLAITIEGWVAFDLLLDLDLSFESTNAGRFGGPTNANVGGQPLSVDGTFELIP